MAVSITYAKDVSENALPVADELVLFASGNPQPWETRTSGVHGGKVEQTGTKSHLLITATRKDSGGGISLPTFRRFEPLPYLQDVCMRLVVKYRMIGDSKPQTLKAMIQTMGKKQIFSKPQSIHDAQSIEDGWQVLRFTFPNDVELDTDDVVANVRVIADQACQFQVDHIAVAKLRNVSVHVTNPTSEHIKTLQIKGKTLSKKAKVFLKIIDATGKKHLKVVDSANGTYSLTWDNPPLTLQKENTLTAHINKGNEVMDQAIDQNVFGYQTDTDHLWLKVEGRHIVTSELSKDGKQPFIPVGVGYARNVIIPAQDEAVAAFCKSMHLNTIRLPFYLRYFNNRTHEPIDLDYHLRTFVDPVIQAAKRHGLYVILDCHSYFSGQVNEAKARQSQKNVSRWDEDGVNEWINRWVRVAEYYKDEPYILGYELCNEPHDIKPALVREWYTRCRNEIRKVDQRHILFVGNYHWTHSRSLEPTWGGYTDSFDAPYNNTVYAFHDYPTDDHPWIVQKHITAFMEKYNVPVLCTEFGASWWDHDETTCREFQSGVLGVFAKHDVGWMVWALKKVVNNPRHPHPLPQKIADQLPKDQRPNDFDSCAYSDIWGPIARIMGSPMPEVQSGQGGQ
tara:strand:- start:689 stop:2551 length:1863 start_codon:yes stop_codon:yes gene_type:complete